MSKNKALNSINCENFIFNEGPKISFFPKLSSFDTVKRKMSICFRGVEAENATGRVLNSSAKKLCPCGKQPLKNLQAKCLSWEECVDAKGMSNFHEPSNQMCNI